MALNDENRPSRAEMMIAKMLEACLGWGSWLPLYVAMGKKALCCPPDQRQALMETATKAIAGFEQVDG